MDIPKIKIICDTNIWYDLAEQKIQFTNYCKNELISTYLNIYELLTSTNLKNEHLKVYKSLDYLLRNSSNIYLNPFDYFKKMTSSVHDDDKNQINILQKILNLAINKLKKTDFDITSNNEIKNLWFTEDNCSKKIKNDIKLYLKSNNSKFTKSFLLSKVGKERHLENTQDCVLFFLSKGEIKSYQGNKHINLDLFELFIFTLNTFFIKIEKDGFSWQSNDLEDIFSLIYVQPNSLYWTSDKRLKNLISDAGMTKYLFQK